MSLPLLLACVAPDRPIDRAPITDTAPAADFPGVGSVAWDGADGLVVRWDAPGEDCEVEVVAPDGALAARVPSRAGELAIGGLADGEYVVRVVRHSDGDDGGRAVRQLVGANRLVLRSFVPLEGVASLWGDGDLVVVGGRESGASFWVFDLSDPTAPLLLAAVEGAGYSKEAKFDRGLAWVQVEGPERPDAVGARAWDLSDPAAPAVAGEVGGPVTSVHNLWAEDGWLYLTDNRSNGMRIYDASDPARPFEVWHWVPPSGWVHDQVVVRDRAYVSWWDGLSILDVADPRDPVELGRYDGAVPNLHNAWPTEDDRFLFATSEIAGGTVSVFDVSEPSDLRLVGEIRGLDPASSSHNAHVRGRYLFTAWYTEGLVVHDVSDPLFPREVGRYDTLRHERPDLVPPGPFHGAWGVWPYGEHVVVSDKDRGLFVFDFFEEEES